MADECKPDTEDNPKMRLPCRDLGFRPQKEIVYNKFLPYADEIDAESQIMFAEIKENLGRAVMLREIKPGCCLWSSRLRNYLYIYGMKFSKEDHIILIKLMYELVTIPNLEPELVNKFSSVLLSLLRKKELISPDDLELPWRPLYNLMHPIKGNSLISLGIRRQPPWLRNILRFLIRSAKVYFPLSTTQEILDELRPTFCPFDRMTMCASLLTLECFLPFQLPPKYHSIGHQLWLDEFMTMWKVCHNAPQWENDMMWIMARLAVCNIGYINWEQYFPLMFTRFVRCLNLPVTYKQMHNSRNHKIEVPPIAMWIVAVLGNGSSAQMYLEKFLKTIETYFYPANFGRWIGKLRELLIKLPYHFIVRLHKERYDKPTWETPIPDNYKLTDNDVDAFVKSMLPLAMTAMFSKFGVNDACHALQHLAAMRPNLVIPDMLERMYSTFDSLTEPHKLTASMICMVAVARPMVQGSRNVNKGYTYPEGPTHVLPLLFSSLPGIDPNDIGKCFATFRLISVYATMIPIVDSSRSTATMTEEERMICEATSRFEDFILQFLDRVFMFIDSSSLEDVPLESCDGDLRSRLESVAETALSGVCTTLLMETSDTIFKSALHKLRTFMTERILETKVAGQLAAVVCKSFSRFNGRDTLRALVPVLAQTILPAVGEGEDVLKEENLDHRLLHAMLILSAVVDTPGNNLLPHMDTLLKVLDYVLLLRSTDGNKLACHLLNCILTSLSTITPCQYRSSTKRDYNDPNYPYVRDWGQSADIDTFRIIWYTPGEEEIATIQRIFSRYLTVQIDKLKGYCMDSSTLTREELSVCLNIVCNIIRGSEFVLPVWTEAPLKLVESSLKCTSMLPTDGMKRYVTMPDGSNVRYYIAGVMSEVQRAMLKNAEDNTKSFFALIQIWSSLLLGKIRLFESHDARRKNFHVTKKLFEDKLVKNKGRMGPIMLERCDMQHEARLLARLVALTETHKRIMLELFTLAISRYADVRMKAQSSLHSALKYFPYSYTFIVPRLIDILAKDTEEHHDAYKGVLYMLFGPVQDPIITVQHWSMLRSLWPAIVLSKPSEKLSVIRLKENIVDTVSKFFIPTTIKLEVPDSCLTAARALWKHLPRPALPQPSEDEVQRGVQNLKRLGESNLTAYNGLLDELLRCILEESLHWRHRLMAMSFIRDLVHPDQVYSVKIVRYFLQALVHDSLEERKIAIKTVVYILTQQKRKHPKITIDAYSLSKNKELSEEQSKNIIPGMRADNSWLQYNYKTRPLTAEQWDESKYLHLPYIGYYTWPQTLEVYAPSSQQPCLDPEVRKLTDCEKEVDLFFNDSQNIKKLISYLSLEEKKGKDKFNGFRSFLFKGLFRNHGIGYLKHFLPHLQRLVTDKHESSQRCAAEITAGIIRGAKHWSFQMTCEMWQSLLPIVRTALSNLTEETVIDWGTCFATVQQARDPNRHHWLLECLMEETPLKDLESSFVECGRLYVLQSVLTQQSWRVNELLLRLLTHLENRLLTNPFQNVRERLASMLVIVFETDLRFPRRWPDATDPNMQTLIDKIVPRLERLVENSTAHNKLRNHKREESLLEKVANVSFDEMKGDSSLKTEEQEMPRRLLKTVCRWITGSMLRSQYGATPGFYQIFPFMCQLESSEADEELNKSCLCALAILAQAFTLPEYMPVALTSVKTISEHSSWSSRLTSLEFLQVLVFHNMGIILSDVSWIDSVKSIVLRLLEDERLEVREKASQVLGGLLHCTFIEDQEKLLEEFKKKTRTRLHKKNNENASKNAKIDAIRIRHAGVLGLCAFIRAHPYDVPKYIPPVFEHLGLHMNDPQPIPMTIRKTLSDFKRTHYDGWTGMNGHVQHFTEEQLAVLQDLTVPPPHYA
ncbi:proteasome activator complex subunit 4B [Harpegnathos saltator]|uniref:Proteasome activator complex subunit 4 n=1 Tax=Harpegnathos saltator TaxID=610380 RepID=E2B9B8_HARSA|nr:proteasome activator complex subunit 4B [Harpegnathos saltator]EFN87710.1 Proteasome activator complex subunit 4 [Harpegnathos saltator]